MSVYNAFSSILSALWISRHQISQSKCGRGSESPRRWRAPRLSEGRFVILASATMMYKARRRTITLTMSGIPDQSWRLNLSSDPDPTEGYTEWLPSRDAPAQGAIELNYRLTADR
jgi:hypothetical protein